MMHVMMACMDISTTSIPCSHIHDSPTAHVPLSTFPCPQTRSQTSSHTHSHVPKHVPIHVPMFLLGQSIHVLQFWGSQKSPKCLI